jgi:TRAP-type C4-dicarboxylate transport system substrate-binding protein
MNKLSIFSTAMAATLAAGLAITPAQAQKTYTMKIGFVTINDSNHMQANWLKKEIEAKSAGRIKVGVFPAAQLGKIPRQIEGIQLGTQEAFNIPPGFFIGINRAFMVTDAPGLFTDEAHQYRAVNHEPFREKFLNLAEKQGIVGGSIWSCGSTSVNTVKPFRTLADIKGLKIRVLATPLERAVMEKMGATGVPMPYSEVLPGMQRGTIDGVRTGIIVMYPSKFYTVAKYVNLIGTAHIACAQFLSKAWLKTLPDDLREIVMQAERDVTPLVGKWGEDMTRAAEKAWEKVGEVSRLSDEERNDLIRRVAPIGDEILGNDPRTSEMFALLKQAAAATRQ